MSGWATCLKGVGMAGRNKERSEITDKGVELSKLETESGTFYRGRYQRMVADCWKKGIGKKEGWPFNNTLKRGCWEKWPRKGWVREGGAVMGKDKGLPPNDFYSEKKKLQS